MAAINFQSEKQRFSQPLNDGYLIGLIQCYNQPCSCEQHTPVVDIDCVLAPLHERARHHAPGHPVKGASLVQEEVENRWHEAIALARIVERNVMIPEEDMSDLQKFAVKDIREGVYPGLTQQNASLMTSEQDMSQLFDRFNVLFFFGVLKIQFQWKQFFDGALGKHFANGIIQMTPVGFQESDTENYMRSIRIATLLHEATHALFAQYACRLCPTYSVDLNSAGNHGRAFMIVAIALDKAYRRLFGEIIDVGGPEDWLWNWEHVHQLPSIHDMKEWRWVEKYIEREKRHRERDIIKKAAQATNDLVHPSTGEMRGLASISSSLVVSGDAVHKKWTTRHIYRRCKILLARTGACRPFGLRSTETLFPNSPAHC